MIALSSLYKQWLGIPLTLRRFCIKALVLILCWKLAYHLYLKPHRTIDAPLTNITAVTTASFLQVFYSNQEISSQQSYTVNSKDHIPATILLNGQKKLGIADACNALELFVLYVGFIVCFPTTSSRMCYFILGGIVGIFILNILRCSGMFWFNLYKSQWFDFAHHYAFKIIVYTSIFGAWVWYCKKVGKNV